MNLLELDRVHVRVDLGSLQVGVAEHFLDETDVGAILQHAGGHAVTEHVARTAAADSCLG